MQILYFLVIGLVIGALAKLVMPGRDPGGIIVTMFLGVAGSVLAGVIGQGLGWYPHNHNAGFIASIVGALILLATYRLIAGPRRELV